MPAALTHQCTADLRSPQSHRTPPLTPQQPSTHRLDQQSPKVALRSFFVLKNGGRPGSTYEPVQKLGEGAFGVAHLVRDKRTETLRVLKTINKVQSQVPPAQLEREIRNLKACDHPNIIRLFEYYEDYENIYLIMERAAGGELQKALQEQRNKGMHLPERWVATIIRQCLQAIAYVHSMGIIHKDLKSENILLLHECDVNDPQSQPHAVIIDLGIAELFSARLGRRARCTVVAGTPTHMAPEVWCGNFGPVADVWSLGVVQFELLSGELPFFCSSLNSAAEWIRLHRQGPNWALLSHCTGQARALCQRMLSCDERMRPTAQQCLGHAWCKDDAGDSNETLGANDQVASDSGTGDQSTGKEPGLGNALSVYSGRSKFEKTVLFQVTSNLHTSQISHISDIFANLDGDKSGTISPPELVAALKDLGVQKSDAESYANCMDLDRNGRVEYTEFLTACIGLLYESLRGLLWSSFCVIDVDGNGVLRRDEVQTALKRAELLNHGFPGDQDSTVTVDEVLAKMDVDRNGHISFDELCKHFLPARPEHLEKLEQTQKMEPVPTPPAALQDDEFAQLLDEIEADHGKRTPSPIVKGSDSVPKPVDTPVAVPASVVRGTSPTLTNLSVDEELTHLLADICP